MRRMYDLVIVGAGPAGLALAQYAGTRGRSVHVLEERRFAGGRAATSPRLENVPGFPEGVTGRELGERLLAQARRLGAEVSLSSRVTRVIEEEDHIKLELEGRRITRGRFAVLASGLKPRQGLISGAPQLAGFRVHYEPPESYTQFIGEEVCVYGGGNAAGQVALAFARVAGCIVHLLIREPILRENMAAYLADRIKKAPNITVLTNSRIVAVRTHPLMGRTLELTLATGKYRGAPLGVSNLFVISGGSPDNSWVRPLIQLDERGYVETSDYRTNRDRVFAIGDACTSRGNTVMAAYGDAARVLANIYE